MIDSDVQSGAVTQARVALKDIEKNRNDFTENLEELWFMLGENSDPHEEKLNEQIRKYRRLVAEVGPSERTRSNESSAPKLKPIEIPPFSGALTEWTTFSGLFDTMVFQNPTLTDMQRMHYLKTSVKGDAAKLIANVEIVPEKLKTAWTILTDRYDNKRAIRDAHMESFLKMPTVYLESAAELRRSHDQGKECVELLKKTSKEQMMLHILIRKLPNETRKIYEQARVKAGQEETLDEFFEFLNGRCQVLESIGNSQKFESRKTNKPQFTSEKCVCCDGGIHEIYKCEKFQKLSVIERRDIVKKKLLCLLCLRPKHTVAECKFKKMCPQCNKKHNGLIHMEEKFKQNNHYEKSEPKEKKSFVATTAEEEIICATTFNNDFTTTLLATAIIKVKINNELRGSARVLINQGSMSSFISERAVKRLKLTQQKMAISVSGIGGKVQPSKGTVSMEISARYPTC